MTASRFTVQERLLLVLVVFLLALGAAVRYWRHHRDAASPEPAPAVVRPNDGSPDE